MTDIESTKQEFCNKYISAERLKVKMDFLRDLDKLISDIVSRRHSMDKFTQGYVCACANLVNMHGESTMATEMLSCNFDSIEGLRKAGVEESDIQTLMGTINEIERKRKLKREQC